MCRCLVVSELSCRRSRWSRLRFKVDDRVPMLANSLRSAAGAARRGSGRLGDGSGLREAVRYRKAQAVGSARSSGRNPLAGATGRRPTRSQLIRPSHRGILGFVVRRDPAMPCVGDGCLHFAGNRHCNAAHSALQSGRSTFSLIRQSDCGTYRLRL